MCTNYLNLTPWPQRDTDKSPAYKDLTVSSMHLANQLCFDCFFAGSLPEKIVRQRRRSCRKISMPRLQENTKELL